MAMPLVDVVLVHYNRPHELLRSIRSLRENLSYPALRWIVADDHSPGDVCDFIKTEVQPDLIFRTKKQSGLGINTNNALKRLDSDFVFLTMDDRVLRREIDLRPGVDILAHFEEFGMVRYGGIEGHRITCRLREFSTNPWSIFDGSPSRYHLWELLGKGYSDDLYVYSGTPHLKHRRFHDHYGLYKEGLKLGPTEEEFAHRFLDMGGPSIICFPEFVACYFEHIGHSWQHTEHDIGWAGDHWNI